MTETQEQKDARHIDFGRTLECIGRFSDNQLVVLRFSIDLEQKARAEQKKETEERAETLKNKQKDAILKEVKIPRIYSDRIGKFPILYNRLLTMPGISSMERQQCLGDFFTADDNAFCGDTSLITGAFTWDKMPSGNPFWNTINNKVAYAEAQK